SEMPQADKPEGVGLSSERLQRLRDRLHADIKSGTVPGAVLLVARHGKIACHEAFGQRDREAGAVMSTDTIFRIASMTKPFTSVAAMMLAADDRARPAASHLRSDVRASRWPVTEEGL